MARTLDSFQNVGYLADNGKTLHGIFPCFAAVSYTRNAAQGGYDVRMSVTSIVTGAVIAIFENHYATDAEHLEDLGVEDTDEVWEVPD